LRPDVVVFVFHQHVINNNETARAVTVDSHAADDCHVIVTLRILSPSVSYELELFPQLRKSPPERVHLEQQRFSDETISAMGGGSGLLDS
jgi:hypothetical protein